MSLALARLKTLRRQSGAAVAETSIAARKATRVPDAALPATHGARKTSHIELDTLRKLIRLKAQSRVRPAVSTQRTLPGTEIAEGLWLTEAWQPLDPVWPEDLCCVFDRRTATVAPHDLLFFDTETTGLSGGTGTRAFMIGAADIEDSALRIRQLTIASTRAEEAMLRTFETWLKPSTTLVSYNGKSYDAPLLKTRYRLIRMQEPLSPLDHIDLLYPSRRHWKGVYENCRLATIEREVLGVVREDDLPGSEAPGAWLQFLRGGSADLLKRVMAHNHQDVVSLARLFLRLSETRSPVAL